MSERIIHPEHHHSHEKLVDEKQLEKLEHAKKLEAEKARQHQSEKNLAEIRKLAQAEAAERETVLAHDKLKDDEPDTSLGSQQAMKEDAYKHTLQKTRRHLTKTERRFSKVAHNAAVEAVSAAAAQTVARPSGLLGGGICAFLGSLIVLYYAKHYGFHYNYGLVLILFVGGFAVGMLLELLVWALYSRRKKSY